MTSPTRAFAAVAIALLLAACSDPPPQETAAPTAEAEPGAGPGGDPIALSALMRTQIEGADLAGELVCSFSGGDAVLLLAKGDVASTNPAFGIVNVAGYTERVAAPGGYDGMVGGAVFTGPGWTLRIAVTGPATVGGESPPRPATLTAQRGDGAERVYPGEWVCGP